MENGDSKPTQIEIADLFFELASNDRLALLTAMGAEKQRATQLAVKISASIQEVSKHLARLQVSGLVDRDRDGYFHLTAVGRTITQFLPSFTLLAENMGYFLNHDLSMLPTEFVGRIGELSRCRFVGYTGEVLGFYEDVIEEAQEHIWVMMDHQIRSNRELVAALSERRVAVRYMVPEGIDIRRDHDEAKAVLGELLEVRLPREVHVAVLMNENRAGIALSDLSGRVDYNAGFWSTDPKFRRWCEDIFEFHWKDARRVSRGADATVNVQGGSKIALSRS